MFFQLVSYAGRINRAYNSWYILQTNGGSREKEFHCPEYILREAESEITQVKSKLTLENNFAIRKLGQAQAV